MLLQGVWHDSYGIYEGEEVNVSFGLSRYLRQLTELLASADKIRSDAVKNASRCSICYVPTQQKIRPDVVQATSGRNFSFMKTAA